MKNIYLIILMLFSLHAQGQNNSIFSGGTQDGYAPERTASLSHNSIFHSEREDGFASQRFLQKINNKIFYGGQGDGYAGIRLAQPLNSAIFSGGKDDGYDRQFHTQLAHNAIFAGGRDDGYEGVRFAMKSHNHIFAGGRDDGFDVFRIQGIPPSANPNLPVEFLSFEAWWEGETVELYWVTASEVNHDHFEVERSTDAQLFEPILQEAGQGGPNEIQEYQSQDLNPLKGRSFYRLKAVDLDGALTYSSIVELNQIPETSIQLSVYPNPTESMVHLSLSGQFEGELSLEVFDLMGRKVAVPTQEHHFSNRWETELDLSHLSTGIYMIRLLSDSLHQPIVQKVQKR